MSHVKESVFKICRIPPCIRMNVKSGVENYFRSFAYEILKSGRTDCTGEVTFLA
jgi:hypothetical protein